MILSIPSSEGLIIRVINLDTQNPSGCYSENLSYISAIHLIFSGDIKLGLSNEVKTHPTHSIDNDSASIST